MVYNVLMPPMEKNSYTLYTWQFLASLFVIIACVIVVVLQVIFSGSVNAPTAILLTVIFVVWYFFSTIVVEKQRHERLNALAIEMRADNVTLEARIAERTQDLFRSKTHTDAIIESLTLGLVEYQGNNTVVRVNKAAEEMLGIKRNDVVGKQILQADMAVHNLSSLGEVTFFTSTEAMPKQKQGNPYEATVDEITITYPAERTLQVITLRLPNEATGEGGFIKLLRDITREKLVEREKIYEEKTRIFRDEVIESVIRRAKEGSLLAEDRQKYIKVLTREMKNAARILDFERATILRDQIYSLKNPNYTPNL